MDDDVKTEHVSMDATRGLDPELVRRAVRLADPNALRMALYQCTRDPELARMTLERPTGVAGANGSMSVVRLTEADAVRVAEKAAAFLLDGAATAVAASPDDEELKAMMELLRDEKLSQDAFVYGKNAAAFDGFAHDVRWAEPGATAPANYHVAIVGAGFSGIATAIQLGRLGISYTIYERGSRIGGTWSANTYPDARVDTTNFLYQFSFEKYPWSEYFARQGEVRSYLQHVADKHGVAKHVCFDSEVTAAAYDASTARWKISIRRGEHTESVEANAIVSAAGLFNAPRALDIPGIEDFPGEIVHTARWDSSIDLTGRRVAVIGNGSTGVQLLGAIAAKAESVTLFQRTAQWITKRAKYGESIPEEVRWLLGAMPFYWNWYVYSVVREATGMQQLQEPDQDWIDKGGLVNPANDALRASMLDYIHEQLDGRPDLIEKVTPHYPPLARRLVVDNGWYETLRKDHVELVTDPIERLTPNGVQTSPGAVYPVDFIVSATGFDTATYLHPVEYRGSDGSTLEEHWAGKDGPRAFLGLTVPTFPNLFIMYGPNSQPRSGALISFVEAWAAYIAKSLVFLIENGHGAMSVKESVHDEYNARLDESSARLLWVNSDAAKRNYYLTAGGRSHINEPWPIEDYYSWVLSPDPQHYDLS